MIYGRLLADAPATIVRNALKAGCLPPNTNLQIEAKTMETNARLILSFLLVFTSAVVSNVNVFIGGILAIAACIVFLIAVEHFDDED